MAGGRLKHPGLALDGYARIVRNLLPTAGERIEQRSLAAVGCTDESEVPRAGLGCRSHRAASVK